jgi:hypothetical protein
LTAGPVQAFAHWLQDEARAARMEADVPAAP